MLTGGGGTDHWSVLLETLQRRELLPAIVFSFSKAKCDEISQKVTLVELLGKEERDAVSSFFHECVGRLRLEDRTLPQLVRTHKLLRCGIGVHHSGLLPMVRMPA